MHKDYEAWKNIIEHDQMLQTERNMEREESIKSGNIKEDILRVLLIAPVFYATIKKKNQWIIKV